jgi:hypothetical protein
VHCTEEDDLCRFDFQWSQAAGRDDELPKRAAHAGSGSSLRQRQEDQEARSLVPIPVGSFMRDSLLGPSSPPRRLGLHLPQTDDPVAATLREQFAIRMKVQGVHIVHMAT